VPVSRCGLFVGGRFPFFGFRTQLPLGWLPRGAADRFLDTNLGGKNGPFSVVLECEIWARHSERESHKTDIQSASCLVIVRLSAVVIGARATRRRLCLAEWAASIRLSDSARLGRLRLARDELWGARRAWWEFGLRQTI